jgi:hypothetical protein
VHVLKFRYFKWPDRWIDIADELRAAGDVGALYAFTPEVHPTDLRSSRMGMAEAVACSDGLFAPAVVALVMAKHFTFPRHAYALFWR